LRRKAVTGRVIGLVNPPSLLLAPPPLLSPEQRIEWIASSWGHENPITFAWRAGVFLFFLTWSKTLCVTQSIESFPSHTLPPPPPSFPKNSASFPNPPLYLLLQQLPNRPPPQQLLFSTPWRFLLAWLLMTSCPAFFPCLETRDLMNSLPWRLPRSRSSSPATR